MEEDLCKYMKKCYDNKWISSKDGNISFKHFNSDYFYITPGNLYKNNLKPNDILKINLYNNKILKKTNLKPSGEIILHNLLLRDDLYENQDLCIVHCHPPHILAFIGLLKTDRELNEIKKIFPEINKDIKIGKNVPFIKARTKELGQTVYKNLINNSIVALKRHGVVSIGRTFEETMDNIETIEYYCKIALLEKDF
jgi:L-fuculose-phosphate aldolase